MNLLYIITFPDAISRFNLWQFSTVDFEFPPSGPVFHYIFLPDNNTYFITFTGKNIKLYSNFYGMQIELVARLWWLMCICMYGLIGSYLFIFIPSVLPDYYAIPTLHLSIDTGALIKSFVFYTFSYTLPPSASWQHRNNRPEFGSNVKFKVRKF